MLLRYSGFTLLSTPSLEQHPKNREWFWRSVAAGAVCLQRRQGRLLAFQRNLSGAGKRLDPLDASQRGVLGLLFNQPVNELLN